MEYATKTFSTHAAKTTAPPLKRRGTYVQPHEITEMAAFKFRRGGLNAAHIRTLMQAYRNTGEPLDPILLWQEVDPEGKPTGRLGLLDGAHRLAALKSLKRHPAKGKRGIPAIILTCPLAEAERVALAANSKEALPLTPNERADGAWRLVRSPEGGHSIAAISTASGVSTRTVSYMRQRWGELSTAGGDITGEWWRDRKDSSASYEPSEELPDAEREKMSSEIGDLIREALGPWPYRDFALTADALVKAMGHQRLKELTEHIFAPKDDDEFMEDHVVTHTGATPEDTDGDF